MRHLDPQGYAVSGASATALAHYAQAVSELNRFVGNPFETVERALAERPDFVMAQVFKAYLNLAGTEAAQIPGARAAFAAAQALPANERERMHLAAVEALIAGEMERAVERLEDVLLAHPRDIVAMQMAHLLDFYRGDARNLRDRVARRLHAWSAADPGYHAMLGMHAFGLEETGQYAAAEERGREAVALEPRDTWAHHAVAHVMEMQGRTADGIAWMTGREADWMTDSFFACHNAWHLALFHLDSEQADRALALYDGPIRGARSPVVLDMIDASAMLWRMHLRGIDVAPRWDELIAAWTPLAEDGNYAFNDCHAMMAFVGGAAWPLAETVLATMTRRAEQGGNNGMMTRRVGLPVARAIAAFGRGDYATAAALLQPIRSIAPRFGGSHAQRDLIDLTLIEAARRAGQSGLVAALAAERLALKPDNPLNRRYAQAAAALVRAA